MAADVYAIDVFVTQIERAVRRPKRVAFDLMIESAQAVANLAARRFQPTGRGAALLA